MWLFASLLATCIPSRNFMGGARTWQLRACRRVHLLRRLHIRSLLAVFLLNFVFFSHGRHPYWRESLAFFPHKRSTGALGGQACLGWPRCLLVCGLALLQNGEQLSFGPPQHMYNKLGLQREAPPPPPRMLAQQRSPNSRLSIVMSASSASPTLCAWVLSTCNQVHLAQWASSKLKLSPPNHRRLR